MSAIARVTERPTALAVNHVGQLPAATISFNTAAGVSLGDAVDAIKATGAKVICFAPAGADFNTIWRGMAVEERGMAA